MKKKQIVQHTYFYLVVFITLIMTTIFALNMYERSQTYRDNQYLLAKKSVTGLSNAIDLYIQGLRKRVHLLTDQEKNLINHLANYPDDELAYDQLVNKISLHFPQHFSWTIASHNGNALLESFDHLIGKACRRDIKKFVSDAKSHQIYVHTSPQQNPYHFDMMVHIEESQRVFFISFDLDNLTQMIKNAEVSGHHLLLMRQGADGLIEVTAEGSFEYILQNNESPLWQAIAGTSQIAKKIDLRLSKSAMMNLEYFMPVPGTKWILGDLPGPFFYSTQERLYWFESTFIFIILLIISGLIIMFLKKKQDLFLLLSKEQNLKDFIDSSPVMMWISTSTKSNLIHNDAWLTFSGFEQQPKTEKFRNDILVHAEDFECYSTVFSKGLSGQEPFAHEYRQLDKNQRYRWLRETAIPRFNELQLYQGHTGICIDITEQKLVDEADKILFTLLKDSFEFMDEFLKKSIQTIISIPWLSLTKKAGIFLVDDNAEKQSLNLVYSHNLPSELLTLCAKVEFGKCLCGRAAVSKTIQFANCVDHRHENRYPGIQPHGHYNVPLMHGEQLLGVIVLYLEHGHKQQEHEVQFLERVSQILGLGISKHKAELQVRKQAHYDPTTSLPNRYLFMDRLQQAYAESKRHKTRNALIFIDLDHFKDINDSLGHMIGDQVLKQIGQRLLSVLREEDTLARQGGDEFVILLKSINIKKESAIIEINNVLEKIKTINSEALLVDEISLVITISMGIALIPDDGDNVHEVLSHADAAMYQAKRSGRNTFTFFSEELQQKANKRRQLKADLHQAIEQEQLSLYYQPQFNKLSDITGVEALLRWKHPRHGMISPAIFIPIAEESGLILEIGRWVMNTACKQFKNFCVIDSTGLLTHIAINVSAHQFHHPEFIRHVEQAISQSELQPQQLILELTESVMVPAGNGDTIQKMHQLKELGVYLSLDDFGTGYSSLSYLKKLPLNQLKIDKSFVDDIENDSSDRVIIETIISMSRHLNLSVIAEGVENCSQLKYLEQAGCNNFQGFFFSKPVTADKFIALLVEQASCN